MNPKQNYGCAHWHSEKDIVALKCPCHNEFHPCLLCHEDKYGIPPERWPEESWAQEKAILCRVCETALTITDYMTCNATCPKCGVAFNPRCRNHWPLYFAINWLQVLDTAERSQVDHRVPQQLHPIVPLLDAFKAE
jgi:uncharacterized CHY-type Zn-finger protein